MKHLLIILFITFLLQSCSGKDFYNISVSHSTGLITEVIPIDGGNLLTAISNDRVIAICIIGLIVMMIAIVALIIVAGRLLKRKNRDNLRLKIENEALLERINTLEQESESLKSLIDNQRQLPDEVSAAIKERLDLLNSHLAGHITDNDEMKKPYEKWVTQLIADKDDFMDSTRLAFTASHPAFISYLEEHGLTIAEINYVCLYAIGLRGKEVGNYIKMRSHVNISSAIRKKLGLTLHDTNLGIYIRKLLKIY